MIRYARALGWLRWRMFLNAFKGTRRRDPLERLSRAGSVIAPIVLGILFVPAFLGSCVFSFLGGWAVAQGVEATPAIMILLRVALGIATGIIIFVPAIRSARSPGSNLVRLTLLPIPRRALHGAEMLAGLTDPWIALLVPAMVLFPIGIAVGGRPLAALVALPAGVALLGAFLALESCVGSLLALLYRDRRRGEIVTLIVLLVVSFAGMIPAILSSGTNNIFERRAHRIQAEKAERAAAQDPAVPGREREPGRESTPGSGPETPVPPVHRNVAVSFPAALSFLPSELYVRAMVEPLRGALPLGLLAMVGVASFAGVLYALSWVVYRRLLDSPETMSRRRGARVEPSTWKIPGFSPATSAVALAQRRLVLRTVHGKMAVFFTPVSLVLAGVVLSRLRGGAILGGAPQFAGPLMAYAGATFTLLAPQKFLLNIFATDGAGLTLALLSPISERQLVTGKAAGMAMLSAIPMGIVMIAVALFSPPASLWLWGAVILSAVSTYLVLAPASALISAIFPKATDLNRVSSGSNPNGIASLLGMALTGISCAPPALIAVLAMLATGMPSVAFLGALAWTGIAAVLSVGITRVAASVVASRRENLALVAQGR